MTQALKIAPQGILWDLDNTLYRVDHFLETKYNEAIAHAVIEWGLDLDFDEALRMSDESWKTHRFSAQVFIDNHKIPKQELHFLIVKHVDHTLIKSCLETQELFAKTTAKHALITHSARVWGINVLKHLGLSQWFPDDAVFGYETYDFASKANSRKSFDMALGAINQNARDCLMVEDTIDNLRVPHDMGMTTVFLHHGKVPDEMPDFVDHHFDNARDLMRAMIAV